MSRLEQLGVSTGSDEQHRVDADGGPLEEAVFFERSRELLGQLGPVVMEDVVADLERQPGRWNPGGFMVFPLGMHELGSLRLHVWPDNAPRATDRGPSIHSHSWHLSSLILAGTYEDSLFELEKAETGEFPEVILPKLYFSRLNEEGVDVLVTDGTRVNPVTTARREFAAGQTHAIPAGVHHLPEVPANQTAATLVIDSPALLETTEVVLYPHMEGDGHAVARKRVLVDSDSAIAVKQKIIDGYAAPEELRDTSLESA